MVVCDRLTGVLAASIAVWAGTPPTSALAQGTGQLVPVITDAQPLQLPGNFAIPLGGVVGSSGHFVFWDSSAVFSRAPGGSTVRVLQAGDGLPGYPGSSVTGIGLVMVNALGHLAIDVDMILATGEAQGAILTFDGTALTTAVMGTEVAPNSGGARFERGITLAGFNDAGAVMVTSPLEGFTGSIQPPRAVFVKPAGGATVRLIGVGDPAPGTTSTMGTPVLGMELQNNGEALILAPNLVGGSAGSGIFVAAVSGTNKVAATGDPNPLGGTFTGPDGGHLNASGQTVFRSDGAIWIHTPGQALTLAVAPGALVPAPVLGNFSALVPRGINTAGDLVFTGDIVNSATSTHGLFRRRSGGLLDTIAYRGQMAPGAVMSPFNTFSDISINAGGGVGFLGSNPQGRIGIYTQAGADLPTPIAVHGAATGLPAGGTFDLLQTEFGVGSILDDGRILARVNLAASSEDHVHVLRSSGSTVVLFRTTDALPSGGRQLLSRRTRGVWGAGSVISTFAHRPGGGVSGLVHSVGQHTTDVVLSDGWIAGTGERFRFGQNSTLFVSSSGTIAAAGQLFGGPVTRSAILVANRLGVDILVADGALDSEGRTLSQVSLASVGSSPITPASQVVFSARGNGTLGLWAAQAGTPPVKIAMIGDIAANGATILSLDLTLRATSSSSLVVFQANTSGGAGLFFGGFGTSIPVALAGDPAPGGGTFAAFSAASISADGTVAFVATTNGGTGGGVFVWRLPWPTPVEALALNGQASPAGGTFSITAARADVVINGPRILFLADLAGTPATSGYFIRRTGASPLETVVLQGDPIPGTSDTFSELPRSLNSGPGEFAQLSGSEFGGEAFLANYVSEGLTLAGYFYSNPNLPIESIVAHAASAAAFGGGTPVRFSQTSSFLSGERYPIWVRLRGGVFDEGIFVRVPSFPAAVPVGTAVQVTAIDSVSQAISPVTLTFLNVTGAGLIELSTSASGPPLPPGFMHGAPARYYHLTTTATYVGQIAVCIDFNGVSFPVGSTQRLLHYDNGAWADVTSSVVGSVACGWVSSLSPFVVARPTTLPPNLVQNGDFSSGLTSWVQFATPDMSYISASVLSGVLEFYRIPPPPGTTNQAVVFQPTGVSLSARSPLDARFDLGNSSSVRKRVSVLIHDLSFTDLAVCTFWIPPNAPLATYQMRTYTTQAWTNATISFYAATAGSDGGAYRIDNVSLREFQNGADDRTVCVDPTAPAPTGGPPGPLLLTNGGFENGMASWNLFGQIVSQVAGGVFEFYRPAGVPAGVVFQPTGQSVTAGEIFTATFDLGNSSSVRKRVTVLVYEHPNFSDLVACTFWLPPGQAPSPYEIRFFTTTASPNVAVAVYPATIGTDAWIRLDNVALRRTPGLTVAGTECLEPGGSSFLALTTRGAVAAPGSAGAASQVGERENVLSFARALRARRSGWTVRGPRRDRRRRNGGRLSRP